MELRLTARRGENVLVTIVIPVVGPAVLRLGRGPPDGRRRAGRLPAARAPGAGGHRDEPRQPRHRDRLRAALRRPQAPRRVAADPRRAAHRQDAGASSPSRSARSSCSSPIAAAVLGWRPGPGASPLLVVGRVAARDVGVRGPRPAAWPARSGRRRRWRIANGLFIAFLLLGGIVLPVSHLPRPLAAVASILPAAAARRRVPGGARVRRRRRRSIGGDPAGLGDRRVAARRPDVPLGVTGPYPDSSGRSWSLQDRRARPGTGRRRWRAIVLTAMASRTPIAPPSMPPSSAPIGRTP